MSTDKDTEMGLARRIYSDEHVQLSLLVKTVNVFQNPLYAEFPFSPYSLALAFLRFLKYRTCVFVFPMLLMTSKYLIPAQPAGLR